MQYPVPQFLDEEDKIFGPLSLKQFGFVFVGGLICLALYRILGLNFFFFIIAIPIALASIGIAFAVFNGKHVYDMGPVLFGYIRTPKMMVFRKTDNDNSFAAVEHIEPAKPEGVSSVLEAPQSKLKNLALMLDQKNQEEYEILNKR